MLSLLIAAFLSGMAVGMTIALILFILAIHPSVEQVEEDLQVLVDRIPGGTNDAE